MSLLSKINKRENTQTQMHGTKSARQHHLPYAARIGAFPWANGFHQCGHLKVLHTVLSLASYKQQVEDVRIHAQQKSTHGVPTGPA